MNDEELVGKVLTCKGVLEGRLGKMEHDSVLFTLKMRKKLCFVSNFLLEYAVFLAK